MKRLLPEQISHGPWKGVKDSLRGIFNDQAKVPRALDGADVPAAHGQTEVHGVLEHALLVLLHPSAFLVATLDVAERALLSTEDCSVKVLRANLQLSALNPVEEVVFALLPVGADRSVTEAAQEVLRDVVEVLGFGHSRKRGGHKSSLDHHGAG